MPQVSLAARLADRLIVQNDADLAFAKAKRWKPPQHIALVNLGIDEQFVRAQSTHHRELRGKGVLFPSTWTTIKGIECIVAAFTLLAERNSCVPLTILGPTVPTDVVWNAFPEAVRPFITILPRVPEAEVMRYYRDHDLLIFPSAYEGFGMVVLEAMSQGLPVIGTPVGCVPKLIQDQEDGWIIPHNSPQELANAIHCLMTKPELRCKLALNAFQKARSMTWQSTAQCTLDVYEGAIDEQARIAFRRAS